MKTEMSAEGDDLSDKRGLAAGLLGLSGLIAGSTTLEQLLTEVATFTVAAVPSADGAGVTMLECGRPDTLAASDEFVRDVDSIQYRIGEGPCISAAAGGTTVMSGSLGDDGAWPTFGPQAAHLGVHSAISLPLVLKEEVVGALNVYAHAPDAFDGSSRRIGELFAGPAAVAIHNARILEAVQRESTRLQAALSSRATIDHAVGIIMSRSGISADEAFIRLRIMSQHGHVKLTVVAAKLVEQAVRRARSRPARPSIPPESRS